ncbi:uncharacterized protein LOC143735448 isoform X3 [Siphateles boraxobius]|uniref:uncharacterized protein LOC143735448 isoform X3 n=1 Tax=Siphateles boraxobius TaxID=180520 RepID=UPI0040645095
MSSLLCVLILFVLSGVFGAGTDEVKSVSVMEGYSVTLNTDVTEILKDDLILWMFGPQETRIAEIYNQMTKYFNIERFRDGLQMDSQTGSLTVRNIRSEHTGLYKLQIIRRGTSYKRFNVTVYARLPFPVISNSPNCSLSSSSSSSSSSESRCSLVCSVLNVSDVTLSWYKGISVLSSISVSDLSISLSLPLEIQCLDDSYSCVVSYSFINRTTHLNNTDLCHTCPEVIRPSHLIPLISAGLLMVIAVVVLMKYFHCNNCKQATQEDLKTTESEYTQIIYCLQTGDLPQKPLLDVRRTETAVNYQHIQ